MLAHLLSHNDPVRIIILECERVLARRPFVLYLGYSLKDLFHIDYLLEIT
jgi:hypothetical protein